MHLKPFLLDVRLNQHEHHIAFDPAASTGATWTVSEILAPADDETRGKGSDMNARFGPFEVDADRRQLLKSGVEVHLTPKAFDLLVLLVSEAPRVVRKDELHQRLWPGTFVSDATLVGLIKEVRRALNDREAKSSLIRTVHRVGYAFGDRGTINGRDATSTVRLDVGGMSYRAGIVISTARRVACFDMPNGSGCDSPCRRVRPVRTATKRRRDRVAIDGPPSPTVRRRSNRG